MSSERREIENSIADAGWTIRSVLWRGVLPTVLVAILIGVPIAFVSGFFHRAGELVTVFTDVTSGVQNYEWFHRQASDIRAVDAKILDAEVALTQFRSEAGGRRGMDREDKQEEARLASVLSGLKNFRADLAAEYNARSRMANRSWLKSSDLPDAL